MHPNGDLIKGLRELADWLERHPQPSYLNVQLDVFPPKEQFAELAKSLGNLKKLAKGKWFSLAKQFGPKVSIEFNQPREAVCERVLVGTQVIPATPERVEEVYEWKCPKSLLSER